MANFDRRKLVAGLRSIAGEELRSVAVYDEDGYEFLYLRDELDDRATAISDEIYQNLVLEGIGKEYLEELFDAGTLCCTLHEFETLRSYHFVTKQFEGLFISVDTESQVRSAAVREIVDDTLEEPQ